MPARRGQRSPSILCVCSVSRHRGRSSASAIAASRLAFLWWTFTGDCFNVTKGTMSQIPFSPHAYGQDTFDALVELGERIEEALPAVRSWDLNSGKYVGGYAIPELRHLTENVADPRAGFVPAQKKTCHVMTCDRLTKEWAQNSWRRTLSGV